MSRTERTMACRYCKGYMNRVVIPEMRRRRKMETQHRKNLLHQRVLTILTNTAWVVTILAMFMLEGDMVLALQIMSVSVSWLLIRAFADGVFDDYLQEIMHDLASVFKGGRA